MNEGIPKPNPELFRRPQTPEASLPGGEAAPVAPDMVEASTPVNETENPPRPQVGDRKIEDGITLEWQKTKWTLRTYYSHDTEEAGPGPGWDYRFSLDDPEYAMKRYGRTFTTDEIFSPSAMPDDPIYEWQRVIDDKET